MHLAGPIQATDAGGAGRLGHGCLGPQRWATTRLECSAAAVGVGDDRSALRVGAPRCAGLRRLQGLPRGAVHLLRLLSVVQAGEQSWTTAGTAAVPTAAAQQPAPPTAAAQAPQQQLLEAGGSAGVSWWRWGAMRDTSDTASASAVAAPADAPGPCAVEEATGAPADQLTLLPGSLEAQQAQQEEGGLGLDVEPQRLLLWGELYARERRRGLAALLPRRRADAAERLISQVRHWVGTGRPPAPAACRPAVGSPRRRGPRTAARCAPHASHGGPPTTVLPRSCRARPR